jgi:hypothetical protein
MKIRWVSLATGVVIGIILAGAGGLESSREEHARELIIAQMLAIEHLKNQGITPSSKAEIDAEVNRWEDYALRVRALQTAGKPFDRDFVTAPWHSGNSEQWLKGSTRI